jgi:hypothetical protein
LLFVIRLASRKFRWSLLLESKVLSVEGRILRTWVRHQWDETIDFHKRSNWQAGRENSISLKILRQYKSIIFQSKVPLAGRLCLLSGSINGKTKFLRMHARKSPTGRYFSPCRLAD